MNYLKFWMSCSIAAICLMSAAQHASAAFFVSLGYLGDKIEGNSATDVSADGSVAVGLHGGSVGAGYDLRGSAFRWTGDSGTVYLGYLPTNPSGFTSSSAHAVSANGSVVVGLSGGYVSEFGGEAFRWTSADGMIGLGDLPGGSVSSNAHGVSADGSVVVGSSFSADGEQAFRWTSADGMEGLGELPGGDLSNQAYDVSADGSVVVGSSDAPGGTEAFRWTSADGMFGLGDLAGGKFESDALAVSTDGSIVVGSSISDNGEEAFRWTSADGMVGLGDLTGSDFDSVANDVSADGAVIVGWGTSAIGREAFVWDATNGMRSLTDVFADLDVDLTGWTLSEATAISADGTTIVGYGFNPSGQSEAWLANISSVPEPSAAAIGLMGLTMLSAAYRVSCCRRQH